MTIGIGVAVWNLSLFYLLIGVAWRPWALYAHFTPSLDFLPDRGLAALVFRFCGLTAEGRGSVLHLGLCGLGLDVLGLGAFGLGNLGLCALGVRARGVDAFVRLGMSAELGIFVGLGDLALGGCGLELPLPFFGVGLLADLGSFSASSALRASFCSARSALSSINSMVCIASSGFMRCNNVSTDIASSAVDSRWSGDGSGEISGCGGFTFAPAACFFGFFLGSCIRVETELEHPAASPTSREVQHD